MVDELPPTITPLGLFSTRQWYLYREIREYCRHGTEDSVCPKPSVPEDEEECSVEEETSGDSATGQGGVANTVVKGTTAEPAATINIMIYMCLYKHSK